MSYIPIERLINEKQGSIYKLVIAASRRAVELGNGSEKLVSADAATKLTSIALEEIKTNKISYKRGKKD